MADLSSSSSSCTQQPSTGSSSSSSLAQSCRILCQLQEEVTNIEEKCAKHLTSEREFDAVELQTLTDKLTDALEQYEKVKNELSFSIVAQQTTHSQNLTQLRTTCDNLKSCSELLDHLQQIIN